MSTYPVIRPAGPDDVPWIRDILDENWLGLGVAVHDEVIEASELDGLIAEIDGRRVGALTYRVIADGIEVVTLDSFADGVGTALLYQVMADAIRSRRQEVWLITTNDNTTAITFYLRRGFTLESVDHGAVDRARILKPAIPTHGLHGLPMVDEWRFVYSPDPRAEVVTLFSEDGQPVGLAPRTEVRRRNLLHGGTGIVVRDSAGRIYVHRRAADKDVYPGRYDFCAGGVLQDDEDPEASAVRELAEELGISGVELTSLGTSTYADDATRYIAFLYQCTYDGPITHADGEVEAGGWLTVDELKALIADPNTEVMPDTVALLGDRLDSLPSPTPAG